MPTNVHAAGGVLSLPAQAADQTGMSDLLRAVATGRYVVDTDAVALAMITRARALRVARRGSSCSEVLVAADRIEIRRLRPREPQARPA